MARHDGGRRCSDHWYDQLHRGWLCTNKIARKEYSTAELVRNDDWLNDRPDCVSTNQCARNLTYQSRTDDNDRKIWSRNSDCAASGAVDP